MAELWMLYDGDKHPTGKTMVRGDPMPEGYWHIIVSIWTLTADGRLLLTQRHPNKKLPLLWEGTAGSVVAGETSLEWALRELREELGAEAEIVGKIGVVSDYYNLIHRHNINHYFLCRALAFGRTRLTRDERESFHLATLKLRWEDALREYELCRDSALGRLIANRELPVLRRAGEML